MSYRLSSTAHLLTIDVMQWHRDPAIVAVSRNAAFDPMTERSVAMVDGLIDELRAAGARATFFVEASVARATRDLARRIVRAGHEIAVHGEYDGDDWEAFREHARWSRAVIEDQTGVHVRGFRSSRSAISTGAWRFEALVEEGYEYDSSRVATYAQTFVCGSGSLIEVPMTSGVELRRSTYATVRGALETRTRAALPAVTSLATWEIDDAQPKVKLPLLTSLRHYSGRRGARERMSRLLRDFRFDAIGYRLSELAQSAPQAFAA